MRQQCLSHEWLPQRSTFSHSNFANELPGALLQHGSAALDRSPTVLMRAGMRPWQVINALNSGANVYMADFEDSNCPTWSNLIEVHLCPCDDHVPSVGYASFACSGNRGAQPVEWHSAMSTGCIEAHAAAPAGVANERKAAALLCDTCSGEHR